jgi:hypothetical protein
MMMITNLMNCKMTYCLLTDFYDGTQLFQWKTCESWCFLTSIVHLPPAYRGMMLVKRGLKIEVIEMICLWEGLFPDDQNSFQHHQIMDLVSSIPLHGSMLYAWSELLKIAKKTPTGRYC